MSGALMCLNAPCLAVSQWTAEPRGQVGNAPSQAPPAPLSPSPGQDPQQFGCHRTGLKSTGLESQGDPDSSCRPFLRPEPRSPRTLGQGKNGRPQGLLGRSRWIAQSWAWPALQTSCSRHPDPPPALRTDG